MNSNWLQRSEPSGQTRSIETKLGTGSSTQCDKTAHWPCHRKCSTPNSIQRHNSTTTRKNSSSQIHQWTAKKTIQGLAVWGVFVAIMQKRQQRQQRTPRIPQPRQWPHVRLQTGFSHIWGNAKQTLGPICLESFEA